MSLVTQSCLPLCDIMDHSPPGSSVHGLLQARILEWVAIFLLQCMKVKSETEVTVVTDSLRPHGLQPTRLLHPSDLPGKSAGVDCHFLLQGIFPTQGSNIGLPQCSQIL